VLLGRLVSHRLFLAFGQLASHAAFCLAQDAVACFGRHLGARELGRRLLGWLEWALGDALGRWRAEALAALARDEDAAARRLQARLRGYLARASILTRAATAGAVSIQRRAARGPAGRARYAAAQQASKEAAAKKSLVVTWRICSLMPRLRKNLATQARETRSAVKLEGKARGFLAKKRVEKRREEHKQNTAAVLIQKRCRATAARVELAERRRMAVLSRAATKLQTRARMLRDRRRATHRFFMIQAARLVQKNWRLGLPGRRQRWKRQDAAATRVQARARGITGRAKAAKKKRRKKGWKEPTDGARRKSSIVITYALRLHAAKNFTGKLRKKKKDRELRSSILIQNRIRRLSAKKELEKRKREAKTKRASIMIQAKYRGAVAVKTVKKKRTRRAAEKKVAVWCQSKYRMLEAMHRVQVMRFIERNEANRAKCVLLQRRVRGLLGRRRAVKRRKEVEEERRLKRVLDAGLFLQRKLKIFLRECRMARAAAAALAAKIEAENRGALGLQCLIRARQATRRVELKRRRRHRAVWRGLLRFASRGMLGRLKKLRHARLLAEALERERVRHIAATAMAAWVRGVFDRRIVRERLRVRREYLAHTLHEREFDAALRVQSMVRCRTAKRRRAERMVVRNKLIAEQAKNAALERELDLIHVKHEETLYVVRLQCLGRVQAARRRCHEARETREKRNEERALRARYNAAVSIQSLIRGRKARHQVARARPKLEAARVELRLRLQARDTGPGGGGGAGRPGSRAQNALAERRRASKAAGGGGGAASQFEKKFDESAKAWFWMNSKTGEVRWTDPSDD